MNHDVEAYFVMVTIASVNQAYVFLAEAAAGAVGRHVSGNQTCSVTDCLT